MDKIALMTGLLLATACSAVTGPSRQTLIAHRGHVDVSKTVAQPPENTLASLDEAVAEGFGFECDVLYTKDGRVFTMHDGCFRRVYGIDSEKYADMTWDYVSHLVPMDRTEAPGDPRRAVRGGVRAGARRPVVLHRGQDWA